MKAFTILPARAWFVVSGHKNIENRSWPKRLRGLTWIQAGSSPATKAECGHFLEICSKRRTRAYPEREESKTRALSHESADKSTLSR